MSEYEPVLIEILVEVMDPSFVCSVSSARWCGFSGSVTWEVAWTQEGMRCLAMGQSLQGWGVVARKLETQACRPHHFT